MRPDELSFAPLGGVGEIGMNLSIYGFGNRHQRSWLAVDLGVSFGDEEHLPGIDLIMPDIRFLQKERKNLVALVLTHITIVAVTVYLHRHQAHRALELGPIPSHFFRFWLWLTTGMVTKEWAAIHRKHHAKCETEDDPHSPMRLPGDVMDGDDFLALPAPPPVLAAREGDCALAAACSTACRCSCR